MIRWAIAVLVFISLSLYSPFKALAAPDTAKDPGEAANAPILVAVGSQAPFTGMLVPLSISAALTAKAEFCDERVAKAREEEKDVMGLKVQLYRDKRRSDKEAFGLKLQILNDARDDMAPGWWEHPIIWYGVGILSATLIVWGSVEVYKVIAPDLAVVTR